MSETRVVEVLAYWFLKYYAETQRRGQVQVD